jgi:hypothetical protein
MTISRALCVACAIIVIAAAGCVSNAPRGAGGVELDGVYDSEFPSVPTSARLAEISESVRMINAIAAYRTYQFPMSAKIRASSLNMPYLTDRAEKVIFQNRRASGTGLLVSVQSFRLALLTCAHIVDFADTLLTFYTGPDKKMTDIVRTISIKEGQDFYVAGIPGARRMEILAADRELDLAVVGKQFNDQLPPSLSSIRYPLGKAKELGWGTFVYVFGYPAGFRMVTHAIVSSPNRDAAGTFLLNAGFKPGYSGGAIFALRDGVPNFEVVGLVKASKGSIEYTMSPTHEGDFFEGDLTTPYTGDLYVERRTDLDHGVAEAISAEDIMEFLARNHAALRTLGYDITWGNRP